MKAFGHWSHLNFLILKCTALVCLSSLSFDRNFLLQSGQETSLTSAHASLWDSTPDNWEKDLLHIEQLYGFSLV